MKQCLVLLLALCTWLPSASASGPAADHASSKLYVREHANEVQIAIEVVIAKNWHLYHGPTREDMGGGQTGIPTNAKFTGDGFEFTTIRIPNKPKREETDYGQGIEVSFEHTGKITLFARAKKTAESAVATDITAEISGLTCTEGGGSCVPYREELEVAGPGDDKLFANFPADLTFGAAAASTTTNATPPATTSAASTVDYAAVTFRDYTPRSDESSTHGFAVWLLLAFVAGVILNVMPCVLPVVSIKVLSFVQQAGESRSRILNLGLAFSAGIMVVFLVLAALAAFAGQGWGQQFQSPKFIVVMIGIVFAFSLSMFDVFELGVPSQVGALAGHPKREGLGDAFLKGVMATVLATPCSGPFLGSTLAWSVTQSATTVFLIFTMIGLGMASPYVLLTAFPSALKIVPKPGAWMQTFKQAMGFLLLASVVFLMTSLREDLLLVTIAFLVFVALGCWWWGKFATFDQKLGARLGTFAVSALIIAVGARFAFVDLRGAFTKSEGHLAWVEFDPELLAKYHAEGRSVFVDFTANWCVNCKVNEFRVYESDEIRELMERKDVVPMKADITNDGPRTDMIRRLMLELGGTSIPLCAVFPGDKPDQPLVRHDLVTKATMREVFEACPDPKRTATSSR